MDDATPLRLFGLSLDELSKVLAALLAFLYVSGYLILAIAFNRFGFSQISPWRPRILETGLSCFLVTLVPCLVGFYLGRAPELGITSRRSLWIKLGLVVPIWQMLFGFIEDVLAEPLPSLLGNHLPLTPLVRVLFPVLLVLLLVAVLVYWRFLRLKRFTATLLLVVWLDTGWHLAVAFLLRANPASGPFFWFCFQAYSTLILFWWTSRKGRGTQYTDLALNSSGVEDATRSFRPVPRLLPAQISLYVLGLLPYAYLVFPVLPYAVGGGASLDVFLYLRNLPTEPIKGKLLDENDQGYFALIAGSNRALFFPREAICAISFDTEDWISKSQTLVRAVHCESK